MKRGPSFSLLAAGIIAVSALYPFGGKAVAGVRLGVNIMPPPVVFSSPPAVVVIPGTYAYYIPGIETDIFFYQGYWYRPYRRYWYRAHRYDGPWVYIEPAGVPRTILHIPPDFRRLRPRYERIPYGHLRKNWQRWERERYWDRHGHGPHH